MFWWLCAECFDYFICFGPLYFACDYADKFQFHFVDTNTRRRFLKRHAGLVKNRYQQLSISAIVNSSSCCQLIIETFRIVNSMKDVWSTDGSRTINMYSNITNKEMLRSWTSACWFGLRSLCTALPSNNRGDFVLGHGAGVHRLQVGLRVSKLMTSQ